MDDKRKTKAQLIEELEEARRLLKEKRIDSIEFNSDLEFGKDAILESIELSLDGIGILNPFQEYLYVNKAYLSIFGYNDKSQIVGNSCKILYDPKEYTRINNYILPTLETDGFWKGEVYGLKGDGSKFPQDISLTKTKEGNIICIIRDATQRKSIEQSVEDSIEKYRLLFDTSPIPILIVNPTNGEIVDFNKSSYKVFNYSKKNFKNLYLYELQVMDSSEYVLRQLKQITRSGRESFETHFQTYTGDMRNVKVSAQLIKTHSDFLVQYICTDITEEKQRNSEIIESETRYKALVEKSYDAIFIYHKKKFKFFNDVTCSLTEFNRDDLDIMNPMDLFIPSAKNHFDTVFANIINQKKKNPIFETILVTKTGKEINVEVSVNIIPYQGSLAALFHVRDVSKRKHLEKAYKHLVENSLQGLVIFQDGKVVFANKKVSDITGFSIEEFIEFNRYELFNIVHPRDRELTEMMMKARAISDTPPINYEHRIINKNSEIKWVEVIAKKTTFNGKTAIQAAYIDITERKIAEEALLESEEKYKALVENAFDSIYLLENEHFIYVNPKFCEITGYPFKELYKKSFTFDMLLSKESKKIYKNRFKTKTVGIAGANQLQLELITKDKKRINIELSTATIGDKNRRQTLGIMRDITERKHVEAEMKDLILTLHLAKDVADQRVEEIKDLNKQLKESENHLKELNISKDKFFSIIAHDLKGPFSGFLGLSKILSTDLASLSNEEITDIAADLHESAEHLFRLLENLLHWSRIQRKSIQFNPERTNMKDITELVMGLLAVNAKQKNIDLVNKLNETDYVFADANMINTVIRNLISNAIKFTSTGDSITVSSEVKDNLILQINVSDTGVGMSKEIKDKLFRIDSQITTEGTANEKGTGLGLILCKELIEINDGRIWVESEFGQGTTFSFLLPYHPDE